MYYAHSSNSADRSTWHRLVDHLYGTARLAEEFGRLSGIGRAAFLAGLMHDLGKYTPDFQARLAGAKEPVDHSTAGAAIVAGLAQGDDRFIAELIAYAIAGHHAGLPDRRGEGHSTLTARMGQFDGTSLDAVWKEELRPDATGLLPPFARNWARGMPGDRVSFHMQFLGRMIFACLVDSEAWVETRPSARRYRPGRVASRVEAWVETPAPPPGRAPPCRRLPRGGVGRNAETQPANVVARVASRVEAWVETSSGERRSCHWSATSRNLRSVRRVGQPRAWIFGSIFAQNG